MHSVVAYRRLVESLERRAAAAPGAYRLRVALLAGLGYAFLAVALAIALALSVGLGFLLLLTKSVWALKLIKLVWIPLVLAWMILRAMWVRIPDPDGRRVAPDEAPELHRQVEALRRAAGAPALDAIIVDTDLNAGAASVPRLLGLAGNRHFLVLGLPLLRLLSPAEMASVIAHEFGHFGGGHGRFSGWIYRVRQSWYRLLAALQAQHSAASGLFVRFFDWYAPYFNAYSFVLARGNEYEADAMAARLAGADAAGHALVRVTLASQRLHGEFWPQVDRRAMLQPEAPAALYAEMARTLAEPADSDADTLRDALAAVPTLDDTHPRLAQRLAALGVPATLPPRPQVSAAEAWLGPLADVLQAEFDRDWHAWVGERWSARHAGVAAARARHDELAALRAERPLQGRELLDWAELADALATGEDLLPLYEQALAALPDDARCHYATGALRLARDDDSGIAMLERVIDLDPESEPDVLQALANYHYRRQRDHDFDAVQQRLRAWQQRQGKLDAERGRLGGKDVFDTHGLDAVQLQALDAAMRAHGKVGKAWVVRKRIDGVGPPHFVVVVALRGMVLDTQRQLERLVATLELPGSVFVVDKSSAGGNGRRVVKAAGAPTFRH